MAAPPRSFGAVLPAAFYRRPTLEVARDLLGATLVHETHAGVVAGRVVEVEAYIGESDPGCHAAAGPTARNQPLYEDPGHAYVYLNYGVHYLLNVVTEARGVPAAVLLRAVEPVVGLDLMRQRRAAPAGGDAALCRGPGNLARAFGVDLSHNRCSLTRSALRLHAREAEPGEIAWTRRIGLSRGSERYWRAIIAERREVSGTRAWNQDYLSAPRPRRGHVAE